MNALDQLRNVLSQANRKLLHEDFGSTKPMAQLAAEIERRFGNGIAPEKDVIAAAVKHFHNSGQVGSFRDAKLVCYGISTEVLPDRILLLRDPELVGKLLDIVEGFRPQTRKYRRCFQALMTAYFEYKPEPSQDGAHRSWHAIRSFLKEAIPSIHHEPMPEWAGKVTEHKNLFDDKPCEPYGREVLEGNLSQVRETFSTIGIGRNSWVQTEVLMAVIRTACNSGDHQFRTYIDLLLSMLKENHGIHFSGLKGILDRYAMIHSRPEHTGLRVFAIDLLGNPLLISNAPRWNGISQEARRMVSDWIKLKLIEQFFELLSHDGATDTRRVKFWSQYVSVIENVWFALGSNARSNWNPDFKKLRTLMGDQALSLEGATSENNAFVMKIGDLLIVEFGQTGNATYLFDARNPPFQLYGSVHLKNDLKHGRNFGSMDHRDGSEQWEQKFRRIITEHTSISSGNRFVKTQLSSERATARDQTKASLSNSTGGVFTPNNFEHLFKSFCAERGLRFIDRRAMGGKLTVYVDADNPKVSGILGQWGFKFDRRTGVWMKDR